MSNRLPSRALVVAVALLMPSAWPASPSAVAVAQEQPSVLPMIDAHDGPELLKHVGDEKVIVTGTIKSAEWSSSGKVMNITFAGPDTGLLAVVFERGKDRFDKAFGGDFTKAVEGKAVRLSGNLEMYGGYVESLKGRPQMILSSPDQVTIVEAATRPATEPSE